MSIESTSDPYQNWSDDERRALDEKIDRALEQVDAGKVHRPDEARQKLAEIRESRPADRA